MDKSEELRFRPGDIIQDYCEPFVKVLYNSQKGERCDYCFQNADRLHRCTSCKKVFYCNKTCQTKDWKLGHQLECRSMFFKTDSEMFPPLILDFKLRLLRLFFLLKMKPKLHQQAYKLYDGTFRCFDDLMSHQKHVEEQSEFVRLCTEIVDNLMNEAEYEKEIREQLLDHFLKLSGIFKTNAFCIYNEDKTEPIGAGVYIETSIFDHSCKPTAFFVGQGVKMQIRAIGPVFKNETPRISYILAHKNRAGRQQFLRQRYNFDCECERCLNDVSEKDVDFERINQLLESQAHQKDDMPNWRLVFKIHNELLLHFRKMYHEYDERITNQYFWVFSVLFSNSNGYETSLSISKEIFSKFIMETKDHLLLTYGKDHTHYTQFLKNTVSDSERLVPVNKNK